MPTPGPILKQAETTNDRIEILADFPKTDPSSLFDFWTKPDLLKKWWPPEVEIQPHLGGHYHFSWPKQDWHLRGTFTEFDRAARLGFTWNWDHEPNDETEVRIIFQKLPNGGTRLILNHSGYTDDSEGLKARQGHVEGWMHFLKVLQDKS
jgi:uncharacterized protein YndB with AHSA1/START domain